MRRFIEIFFAAVYIVLICLAMASCVVVMAGCVSINETNRAAPNLIEHHRHERLYADRPELAGLLQDENAAVEEYYAAIASGDQDRFLKAKAGLADAVKATEKAGGGK